jgi:hypothetical protein
MVSPWIVKVKEGGLLYGGETEYKSPSDRGVNTIWMRRLRLGRSTVDSLESMASPRLNSVRKLGMLSDISELRIISRGSVLVTLKRLFGRMNNWAAMCAGLRKWRGFVTV